MGLRLEYKNGQTPLSEEEKEGLLIKTITSHEELDEHEQLNIEKAVAWTILTKFDRVYLKLSYIDIMYINNKLS